MVLEVNAGSSFARRHRLRASGDSALLVDGPKGFALTVAVVDGSAVSYARNAGLGASGLIHPGSQITVRDRVILRTTGEKSIVDVSEAA